MPGAAAVIKRHAGKHKRRSRKPKSKVVRSQAQAQVRVRGHAGGNFSR